MGSPENDFRADIFLYKNTLFNTHMTFITSQHVLCIRHLVTTLFLLILLISCAHLISIQ